MAAFFASYHVAPPSPLTAYVIPFPAPVLPQTAITFDPYVARWTYCGLLLIAVVSSGSWGDLVSTRSVDCVYQTVGTPKLLIVRKSSHAMWTWFKASTAIAAFSAQVV